MKIGPGIPARLELLFLLSLPFLLGVIGYGWWWEVRVQEIRTGQEQSLRGILTAWAAEAKPEVALRRLLQSAEKALQRPGISLVRRKTLLRSLHRRFPGLFHFTVLDGQGAPIQALCDRVQPRVAWQRLNAAYRRLLQGDPEPARKLSGSFGTLLGTFIPVGRPISGTLLRADPDRSRCWLFAGTPQAGGWFLAHIATVEDWLALPLRDRVKRWNRRPSATRVFLAGGVPPDRSQPGLATAPVAELWESLEPVVWRDDTLWALRRVGPQLTLIGSRRTAAIRMLRREGGFVLVALLALWTGTLLAGFHPLLAGTLEAASIRLRLVLAVGFAAALPFATIGIVTAGFVREHGQKLEGDHFFRMEGALRDLEELAPALVQSQTADLLHRTTALAWPRRNPDSWRANLDRLRSVAPWDYAKIFGPGGQDLLTDAPRTSLIWIPEDLGIFQQTAISYLQRLCVQDPSNPGHFQGLSFLQSTLADIAEEKGHLSEYSAGEERLFLKFHPLLEEGRVTALLLLIWNRTRLERSFLRRHLNRFARDLPDTHLLVWRPDAPTRWFPPRSPLWAALQPHFPAIRDQTGCFRGKVTVAGEPSLVTAIRSDFFPGSFLVSVTSNRFIRTELRRTTTQVMGVGFLLAFGSALAALIFARSFLQPIAWLGEGIEALRSHRFPVQLAPGGQDELGQLIGAFNRMAEGLQELDVTHKVQETLYPTAPFRLPPYLIHGGSTSPTSRRTQAFDYGPVDDREIAFLIGTCRTTGVTAGLALALAKGVLNHPRTSPDPIVALQDLKQVIVPILGGGVPLDMIYGRLDLAAGTIRLAGRAPLPPLLMVDGQVRPLFDPDSLPPGGIFAAGPLALPPGASLLILSGGHGDGSGWEALGREWSRLAGLSADGRSDLFQEVLESAGEGRGTGASPDPGWTWVCIERAGPSAGEVP